jgi:hypothetical protein
MNAENQDSADPAQGEAEQADSGKPEGRPIGPVGVIALSSYMIVFTVFLGYSLIRFWITPPTGPAAAQPVMLTYFNVAFSLSYEVVLLVVVALCGGLGSMVHSLRSLSWYVGNRELRSSWIAKYVMQPFVGGTLAMIFYFVLRAGFFSTGASAQDASLLGFAATSGLVGLFSDQAVLKLKDVAETLLTKPKPGADASPQGDNQRDGRTSTTHPDDKPPVT